MFDLVMWLGFMVKMYFAVYGFGVLIHIGVAVSVARVKKESIFKAALGAAVSKVAIDILQSLFL